MVPSFSEAIGGFREAMMRMRTHINQDRTFDLAVSKGKIFVMGGNEHLDYGYAYMRGNSGCFHDDVLDTVNPFTSWTPCFPRGGLPGSSGSYTPVSLPHASKSMAEGRQTADTTCGYEGTFGVGTPMEIFSIALVALSWNDLSSAIWL